MHTLNSISIFFPGSYWMAINCLAMRHWKNSHNCFEFRNKGSRRLHEMCGTLLLPVGMERKKKISLAELHSQPNKVDAGNNCSIIKNVFVERTKFVPSSVTAAMVYVCVFSIPSSDS